MVAGPLVCTPVPIPMAQQLRLAYMGSSLQKQIDVSPSPPRQGAEVIREECL